MTQPFFSLVMCVYNVERYIADSLADVLCQTFTDFELIIVDDASPDRSIEIAHAVVDNDPRVRFVTHPENRGLSEARNTGMDAAQGRYLWFPDPDDRIDETTLEQIHAALSKAAAQLVVFGSDEQYFRADGSFSHDHRIVGTAGTYTTSEQLRPHILPLEQQTLYGYAWNKFYDTAYLKQTGVRFETLALNEDLVFNAAYCDDITSMIVLPITPYHYAKRLAGNMTNAFVPDYYPLSRRRIQILRDQQKRWGLLNDTTRALLGSLYARYIVSALERLFDPRASLSAARRRAWCKQLFVDPLFGELLPFAQAESSTTLAAAIKVLNTRNSALCLALGRSIHLARTAAPMLYSKTKSER